MSFLVEMTRDLRRNSAVAVDSGETDRDRDRAS